MYVCKQINDGSRSIFHAVQHPEIYSAGNDYSFDLICKESTKAHIYKKEYYRKGKQTTRPVCNRNQKRKQRNTIHCRKMRQNNKLPGPDHRIKKQTANIHLQKINRHRHYNTKRLLPSSQTQTCSTIYNYCHRATTILINKKQLNNKVEKIKTIVRNNG